jgi:hypothetical protein
VRGDSWLAICWICSIVPPFRRKVVIPVARKVWQRAGQAGLPGDGVAQVAAAFAAAPPERVAELLETLVTLGQARQTVDGRFVG